MARYETTTLQLNRFVAWYRASTVIALVLGLSLLSGTRAFDSLRAASYFLRTRKGPAISVLRLDRQDQFAQEYRHAVVRIHR
jgi:hypothetical protein